MSKDAAKSMKLKGKGKHVDGLQLNLQSPRKE